MQKAILATTIGLMLGMGSISVNASSLDTNSVLSFTPSTAIASFIRPADGNGSWVALELLGPGGFVYTGISSTNGLVLGGSAQLSEAEPVDPAPNTGAALVDNVWLLLGDPTVHGHTGVTISDNSTVGIAELDMSGWYMSWNNISNVPLGGDSANFPADNGTAIITCGPLDCADGDTYMLDYTAHIPDIDPTTDPSLFEGVAYELHLEGVISSVPVPAAIWLFGSGLIGLIGLARRKES